MLKDLKNASELEGIFTENPMAIVDAAYEAVTNNIVLTEEQKEIFNRLTNLVEKIPVGDLIKKAEMFLELDIFSYNFKVLNGMKIWQVIQYYGEESVKQARFHNNLV